ncbi:MAG: hypothetical protein L6U61_11900 [Bacteroidales bacterium]|nr:MAG: hypothetical protein L6U61_11900 [Bacteroidales bacterium]
MTDNPVSAMSLNQNADVTSKLPYFTLEQLFAPWAEVGSVEAGAPSILTGLSTGYNPTSIVAQDKSRGNNFFGFSRAHLFGKLMSYLGYGRVTDDYISTAINFKESTTAQQKGCYAKNFAVSPFPLLAYQKIYQDFFRRPEWESANPSAYNLDYIFVTGSDTGRLNFLKFSNILGNSKTTYFNQLGMFDLRYCNWQKDMIMGLLPKSQYGDVASVVSDGILNSSTATVQGIISQSAPGVYSANDKAFAYSSENVTVDGFKVICWLKLMATRFKVVLLFLFRTLMVFLWLLRTLRKNSPLRSIFCNYVKNKRYNVGKKYHCRTAMTIVNKSINILVSARLIISGIFLPISVALRPISI